MTADTARGHRRPPAAPRGDPRTRVRDVRARECRIVP
jgi:hypothetical protein